MKIIPVSLVIFFELEGETLKVWVQTREDDGPYHGLQEFPGGGIEPGETPLVAAVREIAEEVGVVILPEAGRLFGLYPNSFPGKTIVLHVFLFPPTPELQGKGRWLTIQKPDLSSPYLGLIPSPNHKIIDDLFLALLS